jgi:hypothetical protein
MQPSELRPILERMNGEKLFTAGQMADALESAMNSERDHTLDHYDRVSDKWRRRIKELRLKE